MAKKQTISVGDLNFGTKEEAKTYIKGILHMYALRTPLSSEDSAFILNLLKLHPGSIEKIGCGVASIMIRMDKYRVNRQFYITRVDGSETEFSYDKCLTKKEKNNLTLFKHAARNAIRNQIVYYKEAYFNQNQNQDERVACQETGQMITMEECHLDHHPASFDLIVSEFLQLEGLNVDSIKYGGFGDNEQDRIFEDEIIGRKFSIYHKEKAQFRAVVASVNLTKKRK